MKIILSKLADAWSFSLEFIEWSDTAALGCGTRLAKNACDEQVSSAALEQTTRPRFPGRVPHVRLSVHGPKKTGRSPFQRFCYAGKKTTAKSKNGRAWSESI
jgi:hypothetical protein